ncbi:MAG TPA: MBL fold metallo-hydrolase [Syntrophales bacterium]|nr:MBL fold metallo-hydrolase [Syntrophales bacterium]
MIHAVPNCGLARSYVVSGKDGLMVVDVGSVGTAEDVLDYIKSQPGMSLNMVKYITATHFHIDHIGGVGRFLASCPPPVRVLFHNLVKGYLEEKARISLIGNWCVGLLPATLVSFRYVNKISHFQFETPAGIPLPGLRNIVKLPYEERINYFGTEGDPPLSNAALFERQNKGTVFPALKRYPLGFDQWEVIETPGHTEDSVCFFNAMSEELICGDLIVNMEKNGRGRLNRFCWSKAAIVNSYESLLASISVKTIYPGHGDLVRDEDNAMKRVCSFNN